jgi:hypothetical protein
MNRSAEGAKNVAAVQLGNRQKIEGIGEEADPGSAADRMKEERARGSAGMQHRREETQEKWSAEGEVYVLGVIKAGNNLGMEHTVGKRGNGENKAHERAGSAHVKQSAGGTNRRTDQDERAESAYQRREGNEKRIACPDTMMTTGEDMAEFMGEQNGKKSKCEGQAGDKGRGTLVEKFESVEKFVERNGLILRVSDSKLSTGDKAGAKRQEK